MAKKNETAFDGAGNDEQAKESIPKADRIAASKVSEAIGLPMEVIQFENVPAEAGKPYSGDVRIAIKAQMADGKAVLVTGILNKYSKQAKGNAVVF